jgi:nucleoside permease NupC
VQGAALSTLIPRRRDLARLGPLAMLAGTPANFLTAAIAGLLN